MQEIPLNSLEAMPNEILALIIQDMDICSLSSLSLAHRNFMVYSSLFRPLLLEKAEELYPDTLLLHTTNGNFSAVKYLLRPSSQKLTLRNIDLLKAALKNRHMDMLQWLLKRWEVQVPDNRNHLRELLYEAARWGYSDLFEHFARKLEDRWCLRTAIINGILSGNVEFLRGLVDQIGIRRPIHQSCCSSISTEEPCYSPIFEDQEDQEMIDDLAQKSSKLEMTHYVKQRGIEEKLLSIISQPFIAKRPRSFDHWCSKYVINLWYPRSQGGESYYMSLCM